MIERVINGICFLVLLPSILLTAVSVVVCTAIRYPFFGYGEIQRLKQLFAAPFRESRVEATGKQREREGA